MKKKLLSLVLAGAMVASTSVSAFAAETTVTSTNGKDVDHKIEVTGNVARTNDGAILPGTISVTVPTTANFVVDEHGELSGTTIGVRNTGTENVDIYAYEFIDTGRGTGITVKRSVGDSDTRDNITLYLRGQEGSAYFSSASNITRGIYKNDVDDQGVENSDGIKLASLTTGEKVDLELKGKGGTQGSLNEAIREEFTLKLKIKKA